MAAHQMLKVRMVPDTSEGQRLQLVVAKPLETLEDGSVVIDPENAEVRLVNPDTPGYDHEAWPLLGLEHVDYDWPKLTTAGTRWVNARIADGSVVLEGENRVFVPAGPDSDPWGAPPHTFLEADALVFKLADGGEVRYKVTKQPGKVDDPDEPRGYRIEHTYGLKRED